MEALILDTTTKAQENASAQLDDIRTFYNEATDDYSFWSKAMNMHFGYFKWGKTNPFKRDDMLNAMNDEVYNRLNLEDAKQLVADLGCGMGGTMRHFLTKNTKLTMIGITLSEFQVKQGNRLLKALKGVITQGNYKNTKLMAQSLDGAVAIESFCHAGHNNETLEEAYRVLEPGKRLIIADAFLKKDVSELCPGSQLGYNQLCKGWSLDGLGNIVDVKKRLLQIGFRKVNVEDISLRVAPSVFHVPFAIPLFILKRLLTGKKVEKQSCDNLKASFFSLICGLHLNDFGYYIITAEK